ncbi:MAG TPA: metal-dependent phosphohydrolase [Acidobacteriota bacterium]|nr:metal-dependent phosphohydrolase [Acidobacteriota bacterium]
MIPPEYMDPSKIKMRICADLYKCKRPGMDGLLSWLSKSDYFSAPASTQYHGVFAGGLAAHSASVRDIFVRRCHDYDFAIPVESANIAGYLHDACKIDYYFPNVLKDGKISEAKPYVTKDSFPLGHGEKSVALIQKHIQLSEIEMMLIRWHMGGFDPAWNDYKDSVLDKYPQVLAFHHADYETSRFYGL